MDPLLLPLMEMGSTGVLVAAVLTGFKYMEVRSSKKNGGDICARVTHLEKEVSDLKEEVSELKEALYTFNKDFLQFREEVRLTWARQEAKAEVLREVKREATI